MEWRNVVLCHDTRYITKKWVVDMIAREVFGANPTGQINDLLMRRYEQMSTNFVDVSCLMRSGEVNPEWNLPDYAGCVCVSNRRKPDARLKVPQRCFSGCNRISSREFEYENFGHDLPTWMCKRNVSPQKKVMIVSIDPKRTGDGAGAVYLGTPFGFHCTDYRAHTEADIINRLVCHLLERDCLVYLTDAIKLYATRGRSKVDFGERNNAFGTVLNVEIDSVRPDLILTLGNDVLDERCVLSRLNGADAPRCGMCAQHHVVDGSVVIAAYHPNPSRRKSSYCGYVSLASYFDAVESAAMEALGIE